MTPATTTPPAAPPERYHTLDAMRGVAALLVAVFHFGQGLAGPGQGGQGLGLGRNFAPQGYLAVDLFFGLSGFVIALNYAGRLRAGMPWQSFARLRFIRLYPIYLTGALLGIARKLVAVATHATQVISPGDLLLASGLSLVMLPAPTVAQHLSDAAG